MYEWHTIALLLLKEILSQLTQLKINYYAIDIMKGKNQPLVISHTKKAMKQYLIISTIIISCMYFAQTQNIFSSIIISSIIIIISFIQISVFVRYVPSFLAVSFHLSPILFFHCNGNVVKI
jgi:hypothetical protein